MAAEPSFPTTESPAVSPAPATRGSSLREMLIAVRERLAYTLPIAVIVAVAWAYHGASETPLYRSTATLQLERPDRVVVTPEVVETSVRSDLDLNTYLQIFSSDELRQRVLQSLTPAERRQLCPPGSVNPDLGSLTVGPVTRSLLIQVTVEHRNAAAAAFVANRYVEQFIQYQLDIVDQKNAFAVDYLRKRSEELLKESTAADRSLQDYMHEHDLVSLDNSTNITASRLNVVSSALQQARLDRIAIEEQCDLVARQQAAHKDLLEIRAISSYGSVADYARQLANFRRDKALLAQTYLARHPKMLAVDKAIATVETQLADAVNLAIADLHAARTKARESEHNLETEYAVQEKALFRLRDLAVEYKGLESRAQVAKQSYAAILARLNETTTTKALGKVPLSQLDAARPAGAPFSPNSFDVLRNSIVIGCLVLIGLTATHVYFDDRVKGTTDIEQLLGEKLLGIVTNINVPEESDRFRLVLDQRGAALIEPFMGLHAGVGMASTAPFPKALLVTSTLPGEGKTFTSANLAASFAYHGRKTLLIDCDLRRPVLHEKLGLPNDVGLIKWFESDPQPDANPAQDPLLGVTAIDRNLSIVTSGGRSSHPTPLFESAAFGALIAGLKSTFEVIVIDTPPLGAVSDAIYIAKAADESIYLSRFNRASRKHIRMNLRLLRATGCPVLGMVLNGISRSRLAYYTDYRYYRSYGRYYG